MRVSVFSFLLVFLLSFIFIKSGRAQDTNIGSPNPTIICFNCTNCPYPCYTNMPPPSPPQSEFPPPYPGYSPPYPGYSPPTPSSIYPPPVAPPPPSKHKPCGKECPPPSPAECAQNPPPSGYGYQPPQSGSYGYQPPQSGGYGYQPPQSGGYGYQPPQYYQYNSASRFSDFAVLPIISLILFMHVNPF